MLWTYYNCSCFTLCSSFLLSMLLCETAILCSAHHHGWCDHRHGPDPSCHRSCFPFTHVHHNCGCGRGWLHWHGDPGWGWWTSEISIRRASCTGHCAVCALQKVHKCKLAWNMYSCIGLGVCLSFRLLVFCALVLLTKLNQSLELFFL